MRPKLSIITPSLNQGTFIERTIRSVLDQGYENLEYVIVDGGSTDETVSIIERYRDRLAWWVSEPDDGQVHALNKGLERVTGDIVAYINSDDYYLPGAFDMAVDALEGSTAHWVAGAARFEDESGQVTEAAQFKDENGKLTHVWVPKPPSSSEWLITGRHWWMLGPWSVPQPSAFWRRDVFEILGQFRGDMHYVFDTEFFLRLVYAGFMPELVDEELSVRVIHPAAKSADPESFAREARRLVSIFRATLNRRERIRLWVTRTLIRIGLFRILAARARRQQQTRV